MIIQKYISHSGYCSRRKAEELVKAGKVIVNGKKATVGMEVFENDNVVIDKKTIDLKYDKVYIALNKPVGYICSASDNQGKTVLDLVDVKERVYPVGRLDKDSRGLVVLTNDGELANLLTHPRYRHEKEYEVIINKPMQKKDVAIFKSGMYIDGKKLQPIGVTTKKNKIILVLQEGINRQIRKMLGRLGYNVLDLKRIRIANLRLGKLKEGGYKRINKSHIIDNINHNNKC